MSKKVSSLILVIFVSGLLLLHSCKPEDTVPPSLVLLPNHNTSIYMYLPAVKGGAPAFADPGFTATDNVDKDLTNKVKVYGTVNPNLKGQYILTYSVKDAAGNVSTATRTVNIINNADSLTGIYTVTDTTVSAPPLINSYSASINSDNYVNNLLYLVHLGNIFNDSIPAVLNDAKTFIIIPSDTAMNIGIQKNETHVFSGGGSDSVGAQIQTIIKLNWTDQLYPGGSPTQHKSGWKH